MERLQREVEELQKDNTSLQEQVHYYEVLTENVENSKATSENDLGSKILKILTKLM